MFLTKEMTSAVAIAIGVVSSYPYLRDILRGRTKPHLFTWLVWGLSAGIIFCAMASEGAGPGAWVTGFFTIKCFVYCLLALRYGEKRITRSDWICLVACLTAIPLWQLTQDPLWSVVLLVAIEATAFIPTFRKSWSQPYQETLVSYNWGIVQSVLSILALDRFAIVTMLYALSIIVQNGAFVLFVSWRRRLLKDTN